MRLPHYFTIIALLIAPFIGTLHTFERMNTITILGCGAGGMAMAADLTLAGHRVQLVELPEFASNVEEIHARGGIDLCGTWH